MGNNNPEFTPANEAAPPAPVVVQNNNQAVDGDNTPENQRNNEPPAEPENQRNNEPAPADDGREQNSGEDALPDEEDAADALLNMLIGQYCHV